MAKYIAENGATIEIENENALNLLERYGFKPYEEPKESKDKPKGKAKE